MDLYTISFWSLYFPFIKDHSTEDFKCISMILMLSGLEVISFHKWKSRESLKQGGTSTGCAGVTFWDSRSVCKQKPDVAASHVKFLLKKPPAHQWFHPVPGHVVTRSICEHVLLWISQRPHKWLCAKRREVAVTWHTLGQCPSSPRRNLPLHRK